MSTNNTKEIANTILAQLGGSRFIAMTGANTFIALDATEGKPAMPEHDCPAVPARLGGLSFKIGRFAGVKTTHVRITLTPADLYNVEFLAIRGMNIKKVSECSGVYADMLREVFTDAIGLETSLGRVAR